MKSEELTLPSGETVAVRGLTGLEMALIGKRKAATADDIDSVPEITLQIGFAVLGKTRVRDADAAGAAWLASCESHDYVAIMERIEALSGYGKGAAKSDVPGAGERS